MQPEPAGGGFSHVETLCGLGEGTQFPRVPSFTPISRATSAIGRDVSITSFTASSLNSGVNFRRLSGTDDHLHSGPDLIGSGVRNVGGTPFCRDRETDVLLFVTDTRIWPTNNISERGLRPTKTQQK